MIALETLTADHIRAMNYNELIPIVRETNRPPGGFSSIATIVRQVCLRDHHCVLEIGTSTGITSVELAGLTHAKIRAIDINNESLVQAQNRAERYGVQNYILFELQDATNMQYADESFDLVFCGNVTSLLENKERGLGEYQRVLKSGGFLAAIPMYYVETPPAKIVDKVTELVGTAILVLNRAFWLDFFRSGGLRLCWSEDYVFEPLPTGAVEAFVSRMLSRPHLESLGTDARQELANRYLQCMQIFQENLSYMGYTIMILRKEAADEDPELFTSRKV